MVHCRLSDLSSDLLVIVISCGSGGGGEVQDGVKPGHLGNYQLVHPNGPKLDFFLSKGPEMVRFYTHSPTWGLETALNS